MTHPFSNVAFEHIVYIGAGQGDELNQLAKSLTAKHWNVVDADENNVQKLNEVKESLQEQGVSIEVQQKVVASSAEKATWYNYNLAEFNGLHKATELKALFPGLKLMSSESVTPTPLEALLAQLNVTGDNNLLIIDVPAQGLELAKALSETPYKFVFNFMCVSSQAERLFENSNTAAELKSWLLENGYHTRNEEVDDPDFPKLHFVLSQAERKLANELKQAQEQIEQANAERDEVKAELEHANEAMHKRTEWARNLQAKLEQALAEKEKLAERAEKAEAQVEDLQASVKEVNEARDEAVANASNANKELEQLKQQFNEKSEQANSAQAKAEELEQAVSQANEEKQKQTEWAHSLQTQLEEAVAEKDNLVTRVSEITKELAQVSAENQALKQTLETLNKTFADSQTQLLQKVDRLMTSQERQTKRLETSLCMHQFWQTGEYQQLGQEDNLGPHFKQFLVQKVSEENYDIVLQFGASDATLFMAQVVKKLKGTNRQLTSYINEDALDFKNNSKAVISARADNGEEQGCYEDVSLPAEICVFDHNANKLKELENKAKQRQLGNLISTKHAPLVDYTHNGQDYLHYDSDDSLTQIKELLEGRAAKVLVIVSGPITSSEDHNRFPAGPKVLNALSKHEVHFVTDNYHDKNAKDVAALWSRLFDERGLSIEKQIIADDKPGFAWLLNR